MCTQLEVPSKGLHPRRACTWNVEAAVPEVSISVTAHRYPVVALQNFVSVFLLVWKPHVYI